MTLKMLLSSSLEKIYNPSRQVGPTFCETGASEFACTQLAIQ